MNWHKLTGTASLVFLAVTVNLLVLTQAPFSLWVLAPLVLTGVATATWLVLVVQQARGKGRFEGRAVGGINAVAASTLFLGICIAAYAFVQAWDVSWDLTQEGRRSLAPQTVQVLRTMTSEVQVLCFFIDIDDELVAIARQKTERFLEQCQSYTDLLHVEALDPHIDRVRLEGLNITHASTQGTVVIRAGGRQKVITLSGGSPRLEERDFTNALINVLRNAEPKAYFLAGHKERGILDEDEQSGASMFRNLLVGESYAVETHTISLNDPTIPQDCDLLIINNPRGDLHPQELRALEQYLERGGRLFLLYEPWKGVQIGSSGKEHLRPWLKERYGIDVGTDIVITDQGDNIWEAELTTVAAPFQGIDEGFMTYRGSFSANHPITRGFDQTMLLLSTRTVSTTDKMPQGVMATGLLRSTPDFWAESDVAKLAETGKARRDEGEAEGPLSLAVAAVALAESDGQSDDGPRAARLVVTGDADFISNGRLGIPGHLNFALNTVAWLSEFEDLIAIRPSGKADAPIILTVLQQRSVVWVSTLLTVQLIALAGLLVYLLRRRYQ